ncbi:hypothetical protein ABW19_dt0203979 [Dactylella cylindrospora]|nr:hypothetical protein ABW19_dt0203979 [Dactylella cylindrospora]
MRSRIACLQLDPKIGKVQENIHKADGILEKTFGIEDVQGKIDILVLPELAFTGYNFDSKSSIRPYLEPTTAGISTQWAQATSKRLKCYTIVGYPELANGYNPPKKQPRPTHYDPFSDTPIDVDSDDEVEDNVQEYSYNSCVVTSPDGEVVMNYRKTFLFEVDEVWASEGSGFGSLTLNLPPITQYNPDATPKPVKVAVGICMDLNPYRFTAPFTAYEFAHHIISSNAQLVIMPMAWLSSKSDIDPRHLERFPKARDQRTIGYWAIRLEPLFGQNNTPDLAVEEEMNVEVDEDGETKIVTPDETDDEDVADEEWVRLRQGRGDNLGVPRKLDEVIFVACNRAGREKGKLFAGSSTVMTIEKTDGKRNGSLKTMDALGMGEEDLLVVEVDL